MVLVFGVGFLFLGVGTGGLDLGQMIRDTFGAKGGGGGTSISSALKEVQTHPREAKAYKQLADAYGAKGRTDDQVRALKQYVKLAPKDATQLQTLAELETRVADSAAAEANAAYAQQQASIGGSALGPTASGKLSQALGQDPVAQAVSSDISTRVQTATTKYRAASSQAVASYQRLAKLRPNGTSFLDLASTAEHFGNARVAIKAYRSALRLATDSATKGQIRVRIAALQKSLKQGGG